jgi:S-adenosylhomocysteine hydrolase
VHLLPRKSTLRSRVLSLRALGISIDTLTAEQLEYIELGNGT